MLKLAIKIIKTTTIIFLVFLLCMVFYYKFVEQRKLIKICGISFLIVATGSMEPEIMSKELIIIKEKEKYEKGDIVTFIDEDDFIITHRIVEINSEKFISRGDANNINDGETVIKNIEGKVIFHSKILGIFILYYLKPICIIYFICILLLELIKNERKKENEV